MLITENEEQFGVIGIYPLSGVNPDGHMIKSTRNFDIFILYRLVMASF